MNATSLLTGVLLWLVFPLWVLAGIGDWLCHRRTDIGHTSGFKESVLHVVQAVEIAVALLAGLFLEINALVLAVMVAAVLAHTATGIWDVAYSTPRRYVSPLEQHVHSYLEILPIVAVALVAAMHWEQFLALFGAGPQRADFTLQLRDPPLPLPYLLIVMGAVFGLQGSLLLEELVRTRRQRPSPASAA